VWCSGEMLVRRRLYFSESWDFIFIVGFINYRFWSG